MATQEFYIRNSDETEAKGPFTPEQMASLAETGQVTPETLYYDPHAEKWIAVKDDKEIYAILFPEKQKLQLRNDRKVETLNTVSESRPPIDVNDMLAAAEGRTADTKDKGEHAEMAQRCAKFGLWGCVLMLLLSSVSEVLPHIEVLTHFSLSKLIANPVVILGVLDLFIAVLLFLGVVVAYSIVRFRAMLGLGFLGFIYYCEGQSGHLGATIAGSLGLYLSTVFLSYAPIMLSLVVGLCGMAALVYLNVF